MTDYTKGQLRRDVEEMTRVDVGYKRWPVFLEDGSFYFTAEKCQCCDSTEDIAEFTTYKGTKPLCRNCRIDETVK